MVFYKIPTEEPLQPISWSFFQKYIYTNMQADTFLVQMSRYHALFSTVCFLYVTVDNEHTVLLAHEALPDPF